MLADLISENPIQATPIPILKDALADALIGTPTMPLTSAVVLHTMLPAMRVTGNEALQALLSKPVTMVLD